jgi:DNA helicase-2/ATP-dependent DNA helicase PcrA
VRFVADFHIHSRFSRATSRDLDLEHLYASAQLKGVQVVGTGDFTHPGWFAELREKLEQAEPGLFRLREPLSDPIDKSIPMACRGPVRFFLSVEISSIYSRGGHTRKVHNLVCMSSMEGASRFAARLARIGNVESDGRPILGVDSRDLLEIMLDCDDGAFLVPAHIWTPWFSVLGSRSGFDSLEECFGDLVTHIFAVETGLSSDPRMNWRLAELDGLALVSNSDAHSSSRLGREANCFDTELSFPAIREALKSKDPQRFLGTIEFFPEEGKYHLDGHRKCNARMEPRQTRANRGMCPQCGKPVTVGVLHRVEELANRPNGARPQGALPYTSLLGLDEVIAQALAVGEGSRRVMAERQKMLEQLGPELKILREIPLDTLEESVPPLVLEGLRRMRSGKIHIAPGYDGEFGKIALFEEGEREALLGQLSLLPRKASRRKDDPEGNAGCHAHCGENTTANKSMRSAALEDLPLFSPKILSDAQWAESLNPRQREAVECRGGPLLVVAGPGTGKTRTLVHRIAYRIKQGRVPPEQILALTFTNKAAEEMKERLAKLLEDCNTARCVTVGTFHSFCWRILKDRISSEQDGERFRLCDEMERQELIRRALSGLDMGTHKGESRAWGERISMAKQRLQGPDEAAELANQNPLFPMVYRAYQRELAARWALDFDDLLFITVRRLQEDSHWREDCLNRWRCILVDEYQDINLAQYRLIRLLAPDNPDLFAIGDPHQAIYGFRGADMGFFLRFQEDYPGAHIVHLEKNYRSTETILKASGQIIAGGNKTYYNYQTHPLIQGGARLTITHFPTDRAEAAFIARQIEAMMEGISLFSIASGRAAVNEEEKIRGFEDFAILYRLNAQANVLEEAMKRAGIPYQRVGHDPLLDRPEVKKVIDGLRFLRESVNPDHGEPREALNSLRRQVGIDSVCHLIEKVADLLSLKTLTLEMLARSAEPFGTSIQDFLDHLALMYEPDIFDRRAQRVALMTLHASKGLEFPVVFVTGCEEGLIPFRPPDKDAASDEEEERRLFYVGLTRAKERVFLTYAQTRILYGEQRSSNPSPFLFDINEELVQRHSPNRWIRSQRRDNKRQMRLFGPA